MQIYSFEQKIKSPVVFCLGGFDSIHKGHKLLIDCANGIKEKYGANSAVFTYCGQFGKKESGLVFSFEERLLRLEKTGVDEVCVAEFSEQFSNLSPVEFLNKLTDNHNVKVFVCGKDFKFGKDALGNVELLQKYCFQNCIQLKIVDFATDEENNKISTSLIKQKLSSGEIEKANELLGDEYWISGIVEEGRKTGRKLGFPTANVSFKKEKFLPKFGVYGTFVIIDGKKYRAITNIGPAPTFNVENNLMECHIDGFSGDLYGKKLTVYFERYLREIKKFENPEMLIKQLDKDLKEIR